MFSIKNVVISKRSEILNALRSTMPTENAQRIRSLTRSSFRDDVVVLKLFFSYFSPNKSTMPTAYYRTPVGIARITEEDGYISAISIRDEEYDIEPAPTAVLQMAINQLEEYFTGNRQEFTLPIKQNGTPFQQDVWEQLSKIAYGTTITYGQQSNQMNSPLAIRAIAAANGKNNLWVVVPCHRVIGSNGSLTGYAGGLWRKQWLLEHEARVLGIGQTKLDF